jgi:heat shock protein HtpX
MQFAISRRRESFADVSGVLITRNPEGLIRALEKLRDNHDVIAHAPAATAHLWIESPLDTQSKGPHSWFNRLFETHPPIEARIAALREAESERPERVWNPASQATVWDGSRQREGARADLDGFQYLD